MNLFFAFLLIPMFEGYNNEYRIAFRLEKTNSNSNVIHGYHFIRQNVDGRWSGKYPENGTTLYPENFNPNIDNWSYPISSRYYFPEVYYFGVC